MPISCFHSDLAATRHYWLYHVWLPMTVFVALYTFINIFSWDFAVARLFYVPDQGWPLRYAWWSEMVIHRRGRDLVVVVAVVMALGWLGSFFWARLRGFRKQAGYLVLCIGLTTGSVGLGKRVSNVDCPWDVQEFGGKVPYVHLLAPKPVGLPAGHCFPGGFSSGAFAMYGFYFVLRERRHRRAWWGILLPSLLGLGYSMTQWARGAHFPSHDLWSALLGWGLSLILYECLFSRKPGLERSA